jgi:two-component system chemotaxis response regulator CheY
MFIKRTVLLADDDATSRQQMLEILRHTGYSVVGQCSTTDDLLDKFDQLEPEVVIMDVTLFGTLSPLVAIQRLKRANFQATILATGSASQNGVMMEALSMGATDFLLKPFRDRAVKSSLEQNVA